MEHTYNFNELLNKPDAELRKIKECLMEDLAAVLRKRHAEIGQILFYQNALREERNK